MLLENTWAPGAVVFATTLSGVPAAAVASNASIAGALRRAVAATLLPNTYPVDAVFIATVRAPGGGAATTLQATDGINRGDAHLPSLDALMVFLGMGGGDDGGDESAGNSTLDLSYAGNSRIPLLDRGAIRLTFNVLSRSDDFAGVFRRAEALVIGGGRRLAAGADFSAAVAAALAAATGAPPSTFSANVTHPPQRQELRFSRPRWRLLMEWILRNAWLVVGVSSGVAVCVGVGASLRARCEKRGRARGAAAAAARRAAALQALHARTKKWRSPPDLAKDAGAAPASSEDAAEPLLGHALWAETSLPSDVGGGGFSLSSASVSEGGAPADAALEGAVASAEATAAAALALRRGRPLQRARTSSAYPLQPAAGHATHAPVLPPLGAAGGGAAPLLPPLSPEFRAEAAQRAAERSFAARAKAATAAKRLAAVRAEINGPSQPALSDV